MRIWLTPLPLSAAVCFWLTPFPSLGADIFMDGLTVECFHSKSSFSAWNMDAGGKLFCVDFIEKEEENQ